MGIRPGMSRLALLPVLLLSACQSGGDANVPGDSSDRRPFDDISEEEELRFTGTEPFWGGRVKGAALTYSTPDDPEGATIAVERFGGRGGLSFSGKLGTREFDMMVTPGDCSDGMSDRTFPFTVTLKLGEETRYGCAWSDAEPFTGPDAP